mmetsp:Transcript_70553/g.155582  ORF Transcript_70553/g.155582 Transcript_70553/m.155582 type:complete len:112 (-) Transcript_70553:580-915(-)
MAQQTMLSRMQLICPVCTLSKRNGCLSVCMRKGEEFCDEAARRSGSRVHVCAMHYLLNRQVGMAMHGTPSGCMALDGQPASILRPAAWPQCADGPSGWPAGVASTHESPPS